MGREKRDKMISFNLLCLGTTFRYCENDAVWDNNQNFKNTSRNDVAEDKTQNKLTQTSRLYILTAMQTYTLVPMGGAGQSWQES